VQEAGGVLPDWKGQEGWMESGNGVAGNLYVHQDLVDPLLG
jgi:fructose-1,6-bisphosphatase/inositol monophosphatase family enzyme